MWIFTKDGFFSVVHKPGQADDMIAVRARSRADLVRVNKKLVKKRIKIISNKGTDYEFRIEIDKATWAKYLSDETMGLDYENFKDEVTLIDERRAKIYHNVWVTLLDIFKQTKKIYNHYNMQM
ncbi:MAG: hypothetical protein WC143_05355 [Eubacteriales bacterium]|jgi:hypothetical protein